MGHLERFFLGLLFICGNLSAFGYLSGLRAVESLGNISAASPLPLVFTGHNGVEDFANKYVLRIFFTPSAYEDIALSSKNFARLRGPFNAISPYTTVVGFAPYLPKTMVRSILKFGLCNDGRVSEALNLKEKVLDYELIVLEPEQDGQTPSWTIVGSCL